MEFGRPRRQATDTGHLLSETETNLMLIETTAIWITCERPLTLSLYMMNGQFEGSLGICIKIDQSFTDIRGFNAFNNKRNRKPICKMWK